MELTVVFVSDKYAEVKVVDGVTYVPILMKWSLFDRLSVNYWDSFVKKMLPGAISIVEQFRPDVIQVFGTEWPFGQVAKYTDIPVVIHLMGAVVPYNNARFPPGYSFHTYMSQLWHNPRKVFAYWLNERRCRHWERLERDTWKTVEYYMGRTQWDCALSRVMHPKRAYFHVEEALRSAFLNTARVWKMPEDKTLHLISTGCSTFWKGPDMFIKVARILKRLNVDFEWNVVGNIDGFIKSVVETTEGSLFEDCNIRFLGFKQPEELIELLCSSSVYVHTAYIENSPNSICEAQYLGLPVVSTNVGGIASLVRNDVDGMLVASNDPWQMADSIIELVKDKDRMLRYSENSRAFALKRHHDEHIKGQLLNCYHSILASCHTAE